MSAKYTSLLEACDKVQLTGKLGILEESSLDEAASIKMQLMLNENLTFIKNQITRTPLVENIQVALAEKWTQAILEDISYENPFVQPDEGLTAGEMAAGALGTGAIGAGAYLGPQMARNYNTSRGMGHSVGSSAGAAFDMAGQKVNNDVAAAKSDIVGGVNNLRNQAGTAMDNLKRNAELGALKAGIVGRNAVNQAVSSVMPRKQPAAPAAPLLLPATTSGKVKRVFTK